MSTLRPGQIPEFVVKLREFAEREMSKSENTVETVGDLSFDKDHGGVLNGKDGYKFDNRNGVAKYPGQHSPHIGNGPGGPRS